MPNDVVTWIKLYSARYSPCSCNSRYGTGGLQYCHVQNYSNWAEIFDRRCGDTCVWRGAAISDMKDMKRKRSTSRYSIN